MAALALRIAAAQQPLFGDELYTFETTRGGIGEMFDGLDRIEITPPLFFLFAWVSAKLGDWQAWIRLPSLFVGTAMVPLAYLLARRIARPAGLLAAALTAFGPFLLFYSSEGRAYGMGMCLVLLSTLALLNALDDGRRGWWILYAATACGALYTHYTMVFAIGAQAVWALWAGRDRLRTVLLAQVAIAVGFLPWLPTLIEQRGRDLNIAVVGSAGPLTPRAFVDSIVRTFTGHPFLKVHILPGRLALVLIGVAVLAGLAAAALRLARSRPDVVAWTRSPVALLAITAAATPVGLALYGAVGEDLYGPRSLSGSLPALLVLVAVIVASAGRPVALAASVLLLVGVGVGTVRFFDPDHARPPYREVAHYLDDHAPGGDPVVVVDRRALEAYLEPGRKVYRPGVDDAPAWEHARRGGTVYFVGSNVLARYAGTRPIAGPGNRFVRRTRRSWRGLEPLLLDSYRGFITGRVRGSGAGERIDWTFGSDIPVDPAAARGEVEAVLDTPTGQTIAGWVVGRPPSRPVRWVLAFSRNRLVAVGWTPYLRPEIAERYGPGALASGFQLRPPPEYGTPDPDTLRVFSVTGGRATELRRSGE